MRDAIATVDGDEEVSVELELIVEKLEIMGTAGCGLDLWRTVRCVCVCVVTMCALSVCMPCKCSLFSPM